MRGHAVAHALMASTACFARTEPRSVIATGPPSSRVTVVPSWMVTPRSSTTRRKPRARKAGCTDAPSRMNAPLRKAGDEHRLRTCSRVNACISSGAPASAAERTISSHTSSWRGPVAAKM